MFLWYLYRDLLQTLTEEELTTLERNLCISQDGEFPGDPISSTPESTTSVSSKNQVEESQIREEQKQVECVTELALCSSQCEEDDAWEKNQERQEVPLEGEEDNDVDLACSMQYDEEEIEQLNIMVHRVGDHMSTLLSPPSQRPSPAYYRNKKQPSMGGSNLGDSSTSSSTENSPHRAPGSQHEEDERVFFMDDLEGMGSGGGTGNGLAILHQGQQVSPVVNLVSLKPIRPEPTSDSTCNGWMTVCRSNEDFDPSRQDKLFLSSRAAGTSETLPLVNGWEGQLDGEEEEGGEPAEVIAHRTGGMKLSATVIFNPRSPTQPELVVLPRTTEGTAHRLLNSCVCCTAGCVDAHDDPTSTDTTTGEEKFSKCKLAVTSTVIQSAMGACGTGKGDTPLPLPPPPAPQQLREGDEAQAGRLPHAPCCEKCLVSISKLSLHRDTGEDESRDGYPHQEKACQVLANSAAKEKQSKEDRINNSRFVCV